jgi:hypothetical protein
MVTILTFATQTAERHDQDILPAEMGGQGQHASLSRRATEGEEVAATV